jgi:hypothetical protein
MANNAMAWLNLPKRAALALYVANFGHFPIGLFVKLSLHLDLTLL